MPQLTDLLPDEYNLVENINKAIESITASASGGSVTALNQLQDCYDQAVVVRILSSFYKLLSLTRLTGQRQHLVPPVLHLERRSGDARVEHAWRHQPVRASSIPSAAATSAQA